MESSEYLPMFLAEAREHLQDLNVAIIEIERAPDPSGLIDEIFRAAHSFKGMSAAMGFSGIAAVTHAIEDVFELMREPGGGSLDADCIDAVLSSIDALAAAVESVDAGEGERIDAEPLV